MKWKHCLISLFLISLMINIDTNISMASDLEILGKDMPKFTSGRVDMLKGYGGSERDSLIDIKKTKDGGYIGITELCSSTDFGFASNGEDDIVIIKYDSELNEEWKRNYGGTTNDYGFAITELIDGSFIFVGTAYSSDASNFSNAGKGDGIIIKYDSNLNEEWIKTWGGSRADNFIKVEATIDGGFVVAGYSDSVDAGFVNNGVAGKDDWIIIKYDKDGNQEWIENFGDKDKDFLHSMTVTSDNKIVVSGDYYVNSVNHIVVRMYDMSGNLLWHDVFEDDYGFWTETTIIESPNNEIFIAGTDVVMKYNMKGERLWLKEYSSFKWATIHDIVLTSDEGYILLMYSNSPNIGFEEMASIVKCDKNGNEEWVKNFDGNIGEYVSCMEIISNTEILVSIYSESTDLGFENKGKYDIVLMKYSLLTNEDLFIEQAESTKDPEDIEKARSAVNMLEETLYKKELQNRLNNIDVNLSLEHKIVTGNIDIYIKSENMLLMSLSTNQIAFDDFSGVSDMLKDDALEISINSSLPYNLNAYLVSEIQNSDKSQTMDKEILQLKEDSEVNYQYFENINEKMTLKSNCDAGNDKVHLVDFKLKGGISHQKDVYKTVVKFEAEQI